MRRLKGKSRRAKKERGERRRQNDATKRRQMMQLVCACPYQFSVQVFSIHGSLDSGNDKEKTRPTVHTTVECCWGWTWIHPSIHPSLSTPMPVRLVMVSFIFQMLTLHHFACWMQVRGTGWARERGRRTLILKHRVFCKLFIVCVCGCDDFSSFFFILCLLTVGAWNILTRFDWCWMQERGRGEEEEQVHTEKRGEGEKKDKQSLLYLVALHRRE